MFGRSLPQTSLHELSREAIAKFFRVAGRMCHLERTSSARRTSSMNSRSLTPPPSPAAGLSTCTTVVRVSVDGRGSVTCSAHRGKAARR